MLYCSASKYSTRALIELWDVLSFRCMLVKQKCLLIYQAVCFLCLYRTVRIAVIYCFNYAELLVQSSQTELF